MKWLTKRKLLIVTLAWTVLLGVFIVIARSDACYHNSVCWSFVGAADMLGMILFFPTLLLMFSIIIYPLHPLVFNRWKKFALWSVPVVVIFTLLLASIDTGGGLFDLGAGEMLVTCVLILLYGWFFIHSLALIIATARRESKNRMKQ